MTRKKVFVSFDYDKDKHYKFLLEAWDAHPTFDFTFSDYSSKEIKSWDISRVKAALTSKINSVDYTLVIVGEDANKRHQDSLVIGYKNWLNFEIARSKSNRNKIIAVKIKSTYDSPEQLLSSGAKWAMSFTQDNIIKALEEA